MSKSVVSVVVLVLVAMGLYSRRVDAGLIVSATGPGTGSWTTGIQESNSFSWIADFAFSDVSISAKLTVAVKSIDSPLGFPQFYLSGFFLEAVLPRRKITEPGP